MKKIVSLILLLSMLVILTCCSGGATPVEDFLLAAGKMDIVKMEALMTSDSAAMAARIKEYADSLDSESRTVLVRCIPSSDIRFQRKPRRKPELRRFLWS